ncbi:MAG: S23 ribosomal protein [Parcubacteria group bacterium LiPW_41]|nr:MAG: S23 ribosomal protein [Parcubacteria group bacterium LiPW_41]
MVESQNKRNGYDLEERTLIFARNVRDLINKAPKSVTTIEYGKQLARSAGSVGANYIEANESLSKKDFVMRVKICRKEAKESAYWLSLILVHQNDEEKQKELKQEATELMKIFGSIIEKSK